MGNKSSSKKLPKEDLEFLCSNTKFTKAEIKDWYRGFMVSTDSLTAVQDWCSIAQKMPIWIFFFILLSYSINKE